MIKKILLFMFSFGFITTLFSSELKNDENVMFIPDFAYIDKNGELLANIQVWVYEKERRLGFTTILAKYMDVNKSDLSKEELDRLYEMSSLFRVDSENNKNIKIKFANGQTFTMPETKNGGRSSITANLSLNTTDTSQNGVIIFNVIDSGNPASINDGISYFFTKTGISVITDVDDTIKDSNVLDKKELLKNTFLNEFKAIDKTNKLFLDLQEKNNNQVAFHYVSSSPIQLYPEIQKFLDTNAFPKGSVHLREVTGWDNILFSESREHKLSSIKRILNAYPEREFILVGDSGEADPEIYAQISNEYKDRITRVIIKDVTNEDKNSNRYQKLFKEFNDDFLQIITD